MTITELKQMALIGLEAQRDSVNDKIATLQRELGVTNKAARKTSVSSNGTGKKQHRISAEGRARIAAAQRKRWAEAKKKKAK